MRNGAGLICLFCLTLTGGRSAARPAKTVDVPEGLVGSPAFAKKVKVTCPGLAVRDLRRTACRLRCRPVNIVTNDAPKPAPVAGDRPEAAALDLLCRQVGYLWWTRPGGTLLFRKRDWFEQQRYEVPDRWLVEAVSRMKVQKHVPRVADLLRARELTARQILGLNGINTGDGYSYSEFESGGMPELVDFLNREFVNRPATGQGPFSDRSLEPGRSIEKAYYNEDTAALASNESFVSFLRAQAAPIPVTEFRYFQADIYTEDRGHGPDDGWKDASVVVNWKVGPLLDKRQNICLPFEVPNDRRDQVKIEAQ